MVATLQARRRGGGAVGVPGHGARRGRRDAPRRRVLRPGRRADPDRAGGSRRDGLHRGGRQPQRRAGDADPADRGGAEGQSTTSASARSSST
ncbi:hypothetical protein G5V59_23215 [Nocardioides sp. W3-2-3]|nr:hypothetical protein [Nocardioides convexus]